MSFLASLWVVTDRNSLYTTLLTSSIVTVHPHTAESTYCRSPNLLRAAIYSCDCTESVNVQRTFISKKENRPDPRYKDYSVNGARKTTTVCFWEPK